MTNDLTDYFDEATPSQDESSIGRRIVQARQAAGLTTAQLARRLGIRGATLSNWESDKSQPRANRMTMLAGVLNVSPTWLLTGFGEEPSGTQGDSELAAVRSSLLELKDQLATMAERVERLAARLESKAHYPEN